MRDTDSGKGRRPGPKRASGPAPWKSRLAAALGLVVIAFAVEAIVLPGSTSEDDSPIRMNLGDDGDDADEGPREQPPAEAPAEAPRFERPLNDQLLELAAAYAEGSLTLEGLRDRLVSARFAINVYFVNHTAQSRIRWLNRLGRVLEWASLGALVLLAGPWWTWRRRGRTAEAARAARASVPYFVVGAAAVLLIGHLMADLVVGLEKIYVTVAALGSPTAAAADAAVHYLVYGGDADLEAILRLVLQARDRMAGDPWSAFGAIGFVWVAVEGLLQTAALTWGRHLMTIIFRLLDLYGPILAVATGFVAYRVVVPLVRNLARYPVEAVSGGDVPTLGRFVLKQVGLVWKELRAATWLVGFVLVSTLLAVGAVRLLTAGAVVVLLKTLLAAAAVVASGRPLPDIALLCTQISILVYLVLVCVACLAAAAVVFSKAYPVLRTRAHERRRFRRFPVFWRTIVRLGTRVVLPTLVATGAVVALWLALLVSIAEPGVRVWIAVPLFGPVLFALLWVQGVFRQLWRLAKANPLAEG